MPIESHIAENDLNIKDLSLELPEAKRPTFDVEKEISKKDWLKLTEALSSLRDGPDKFLGDNFNLYEFAGMAMELKMLNSDVELNLSQKDWQGMHKYLEARTGTHNIARQAASIKVLDPNAELGLNEQDWHRLEETYENYHKWGRWDHFPTLAAYVKIIRPETNFNLTEENWSVMKEELRHLRKVAKEKNQFWIQFAQYAMGMKILKSDAQLGLNSEDWQSMEETLQSLNQNNEWRKFASLAAAMKIVTAEKVSVAAPGMLQIEEPLEINSPKPSLPEIKNF